MNNLSLQPLVWQSGDTCSHIKETTKSPLHGYFISQTATDDEIKVGYYEKGRGSTKYATGFATIDEAKTWAWKHYNEKMQPYVKPDSITDIANWFKKSKPKPNNRDICTQIGCHFEEVAEMQNAMNFIGYGENKDLAQLMKNLSPEMVAEVGADCDHIELLDSLCDQIVTAIGVGYMMGFDMQGALNEVIRSNDSKFENGKPIFNEQGKIMKGKDYSEPDLTPFVNKR